MLCPWPDCENGKPREEKLLKLDAAGDPQDPVRTSIYERGVVDDGYRWNLIYRERDDRDAGGVVTVEYTAARGSQ